MQGTSATTFAPAANVTRAQVVATLFRLHHERIAGAGDLRDTPFDDVANGEWYAPYIAWASANEIVMGIGNGQFAPNDPVTREQFATILHRFATSNGTDVTIPADFALDFPDAALLSSWAEVGLTWANYNGLIRGTASGVLNPGGTTTRAECAAILMRFLNG